MPAYADALIDRRRLKRRLSFWRILAVVAIVALIVVAVGRVRGYGDGEHIARLEVSGVIVEDRDRIEALSRVADDEQARALIVHIDSPGGSVVGGESLYRSLRAMAAEKPVVAVMGTLATRSASSSRPPTSPVSSTKSASPPRRSRAVRSRPCPRRSSR